jgi:hypothetical protein
MDIVLAIAIAVVGAAMLINPAGIYKFTESWKSNTPGEPSDLYISRTRTGGGLLLAVGAAGTIALIIL